ncbi:MAG: PxKF domain-containing protein [Chloroflexota bacterium]
MWIVGFQKSLDTLVVANIIPAHLTSDLASSSETILNVIYDFSGFFPPVENPPILNLVRAGSAVPIKFSLDGNQGLEILEGSPLVREIYCDTMLPTSELTETIMAGANILSYDASEDQYIYVWKTNRQWAGTCRQLVVRLVDGTEHMAIFMFK